MLFTTIGALCYKMPKYFGSDDVLLGVISLILLILTAYMLLEVVICLKKKRVKHA